MSRFSPRRTLDGSLTYYSEQYSETYHADIGARTEALEKFIRPFLSHLPQTKTLRVFDICFGLGYNTAALLEVVNDLPYKTIEIVAVENDPLIIKEIPKLSWDETVRPLFSKLKPEETVHHSLPNTELLFSLHIKDLLDFLPRQSETVDLVMHDGFSPAKCPQLWSVEIFRKYYEIMNDDAVLCTYSASKAVMAALFEAGFSVHLHQAQGRRQGSLFALKSSKASQSELAEMYKHTTAAAPYRHADRTDSSERILEKHLAEKGALKNKGRMGLSAWYKKTGKRM